MPLWELYNLVISMVNYYDSSFDENLVEKIADANAFVTDLYEKQFGLSIKMDGVAILDNESPASKCTNEGHCIGNCGSGEHCKDITANSDYLYNDINRENSHIYILWSNRECNTYCKVTQEEGESSSSHKHLFKEYAYTIGKPKSDSNPEVEYRPVTHIATIPDVNDADPSLIVEHQTQVMGLLLAHEIAHILGLNEVYTEKIDHDDDDFTCIMESFVDDVCYTYNYNYLGFYDQVCAYLSPSEEGAPPFCTSCADELDDLIKTLLIEGN